MRRHKVSIDSILRRIFLKRLIDDIYQESPILKALRLNQNKAGMSGKGEEILENRPPAGYRKSDARRVLVTMKVLPSQMLQYPA